MEIFLIIYSLSLFCLQSGWSLAPFHLAMAFESPRPPHCPSLSSCALLRAPQPLFEASPSHPSRFSYFPMFPGLSFGSCCLSPSLSSCLALPGRASGPCRTRDQTRSLLGLSPPPWLLARVLSPVPPLCSQPLPSAPSLPAVHLQQLAPSFSSSLCL